MNCHKTSYNPEKEKGEVNQLDVGNKKDQHHSGSNNPRTSKNNKNKTRWQQLEQVIKITVH